MNSRPQCLPKMEAFSGFAEEATKWIKNVITQEEDGTDTYADECHYDV